MIKIQIKIIYIIRYSDTVIHTYIYTYIYICIQYTQIDSQIPCCTETKYLSYQLPGTKKPVTLHSSWVPSSFTIWCTAQHLRLAIHHVDRHGYCGRTALFFCHKLQVIFFPVRSFGQRACKSSATKDLPQNETNSWFSSALWMLEEGVSRRFFSEKCEMNEDDWLLLKWCLFWGMFFFG